MPQKRLRILILNWRDTKNPKSGGAEVLTHEMAKRWAKKGHEVTQLSSRFQGSLKGEVIDGVRIIRMGKWWNVHVLAFFYYIVSIKGRADVVIDEVHWFPFFSVFYARNKTVLLACEVADKLFFELFPYPLALVGRGIEKLYLRLYRNIPVLAISSSTKEDLVAEGFRENNITILPVGMTRPVKIPSFKKEANPTLVFVGRIFKTKGIEDAFYVVENLKKEFPKIRLWVIGRGEENYEAKIRELALRLDISDSVKFLGFVSEAKKFELMQKAHILIAPSIKEGFGLTVPEAGIVGTPSVAYNVEGLRDIIENMQTGILVNANPKDMTLEIKNILENPNLYKKIQEGSISFAKSLSWDRSANNALKLLEKNSL